MRRYRTALQAWGAFSHAGDRPAQTPGAEDVSQDSRQALTRSLFTSVLRGLVSLYVVWGILLPFTRNKWGAAALWLLTAVALVLVPHWLFRRNKVKAAVWVFLIGATLLFSGLQWVSARPGTLYMFQVSVAVLATLLSGRGAMQRYRRASWRPTQRWPSARRTQYPGRSFFRFLQASAGSPDFWLSGGRFRR